MADDGGGGDRHFPSPNKAAADRVPLLAGVSLVSPSPRNTLDSGRHGEKFPGGGESIRESVEKKGGARGLLMDADDLVAEETCCGSGVETALYSILTRLPALHTFSVLGFFFYFGCVAPLLPAGICGCDLFGRVRFVFPPIHIPWPPCFWGSAEAQYHVVIRHHQLNELTTPV